MPQGAVAAGVADVGAKPLEVRQACIHQTHGPSEWDGRLAASLLHIRRALRITERGSSTLSGGRPMRFVVEASRLFASRATRLTIMIAKASIPNWVSGWRARILE